MGSSPHLLAIEPNCSAAGTDLGFFHYTSLFLFHDFFSGLELLLLLLLLLLQDVYIFETKKTYFEMSLERDIKVIFYIPFCS